MMHSEGLPADVRPKPGSQRVTGSNPVVPTGEAENQGPAGSYLSINGSPSGAGPGVLPVPAALRGSSRRTHGTVGNWPAFRPGEAHPRDRGVPSRGAGRCLRCRAGRGSGGPLRGRAAPPHRGTGPATVTGAALASGRRAFWPIGEAEQADYEALRAHVLGRRRLACVAARSPVRPPRAGGADGLPGGRTCLRRQPGRRQPAEVESAHRPAAGRARRRLRRPARHRGRHP